jgi:hypothetical protein
MLFVVLRRGRTRDGTTTTTHTHNPTNLANMTHVVAAHWYRPNIPKQTTVVVDLVRV